MLAPTRKYGNSPAAQRRYTVAVQTRSQAATSFTVSEGRKSGSKGEAKSLRIVASRGDRRDDASTLI